MDRKPTIWLRTLIRGCKRSYQIRMGFRTPPLQRLQAQICAHFFLDMWIQDLSHRKSKVVDPFRLYNFSVVYSPCEGADMYPKRLDMAIWCLI